MKLYTITATALLAFANVASAGTLGWTAYDLNRSETRGACTLKIESYVVYPTTTVPADVALAEKINKTLQSVTDQTTQFYANNVKDNSECIPQQDNSYSKVDIQLKVTGKFFARSWSSWGFASYVFTGGAHGMGSDLYMVLSPLGDQVLFHTVLAVPAKQFIATLAAKVKAQNRFNEQFFGAWSANAEKAGLANLNYSANEQGITVTFNSYDINAYSEGPTTVTYAWSELRGLLKSNSIFSEYLKP